MTVRTDGKLIVFSGPSCVGKSPLAKALARLHPELHNSLQPLVLYNDRSARPGETDGVDYYFRPQKEIQKLKGKDGFIVMDVRGDLQALDLNELSQQLSRGHVFFEGNPFFILQNELLSQSDFRKFSRRSVQFLNITFIFQTNLVAPAATFHPFH